MYLLQILQRILDLPKVLHFVLIILYRFISDALKSDMDDLRVNWSQDLGQTFHNHEEILPSKQSPHYLLAYSLG